MQYIIGVLVFALIDFVVVCFTHFLKKREFKNNMRHIADDFEALGRSDYAATIRRKYKIRK